MKKEEKDIKKMLERFQKLWNESLNRNYTHQAELGNLARQIRDSKCNDIFLVSNLSVTEQMTYNNAILLANYKG